MSLIERLDVIPAVVSITCAETGETRSCEMDFFGDFTWSDGNYACDCNRGLFFERECVPGADDDVDPDRDCGMIAFTVRIVAKDDGRLLYEETK